MSTAGMAGRKRTLLLTWWVGMAALVSSQIFKGTAHGNLAWGLFYGCLITAALVGGIGLISQRSVPKA